MGKPSKLELENLEYIQQQLRDIKDAIAKANIMLANGNRVDLVALQNSVQSVCDRIDSLPRLIGSDDLEPLIKAKETLQLESKS